MQVQVIAKAVGSESGQLQFRYFPTMPGNSTCHVQEKEDLQGEMMTDLGFFEGAQDCICPVTTISQVMRDHAIQQIDLLKVWQLQPSLCWVFWQYCKPWGIILMQACCCVDSVAITVIKPCLYRSGFCCQCATKKRVASIGWDRLSSLTCAVDTYQLSLITHVD